MKKMFVFVVALSLLMGLFAFGFHASAAEQSEPTATLTATVTVTVAVKGNLAVSAAQVTVSDADGDGKLTISDALFAAHEESYTGGAAAGFAAGTTAYGLSLLKLWGDESGSFGIYLNHAAATSLAEEIKTGDIVAAFVYADPKWQDVYCWFEGDTWSVLSNRLPLVLMSAGFDEEWNPITAPVANAVVLIDGEPTNYKTDAEGKVTLTMEKAGDVLISATSTEQILVPPAHRVAVQKSIEHPCEIPEEPTNESASTTTPTPASQEPDEAEPTTPKQTGRTVAICVASAIALACAVCYFYLSKKKSEQ